MRHIGALHLSCSFRMARSCSCSCTHMYSCIFNPLNRHHIGSISFVDYFVHYFIPFHCPHTYVFPQTQLYQKPNLRGVALATEFEDVLANLEDFSFEVEGKKTDCGDYKKNQDGCKNDKNCSWNKSTKTCVSRREEDEEDFSIDSSEDYVSEM